MGLLDRARDRIASSATGVFKHAPYPLANTLDHRGDPGLCGPGSVSWELIGDPAAFVGGLRALLVQAAHPEVAAGVSDHSQYRGDPLGRLSRTSNYVTATTYGAMPEAAAAIRRVTVMHRPVSGVSHRGRAYSAETPELAAWVHNSLTDSFVVAARFFGPRRLTEEEADRFVIEQARIGALLDAAPLPRTARGVADWLGSHGAVGGSPGQREAVRFLRRPPLSGGVRIGQRILFLGATATIPRSMRRVLGLRRRPGAVMGARLLVRFLRWAAGSSPSWNLALIRAGAPVPEGRFRQPLPIETLKEWR